jgi:DNA-binding MarR family transcriptional regulator
MKIIQKSFKLDKQQYYQKHIEIINTFLPIQLTEKEIEILSHFLSLEKNIIEEDIFNSFARKIVKNKLNLSAGGLGNHLKSMIEKGFLNRNEFTNRISIKDFLIPEENSQGYQIKISKQNDSKQ